MGPRAASPQGSLPAKGRGERSPYDLAVPAGIDQTAGSYVQNGVPVEP